MFVAEQSPAHARTLQHPSSRLHTSTRVLGSRRQVARPQSHPREGRYEMGEELPVGENWVCALERISLKSVGKAGC